MNTNREFRKIPSSLFFYEVSEDGRCVRNIKSKKQLKQKLDKYGYYCVTLSVHNVLQYRTVHSLVAECWLGPRPEGYQTDHIDRNKTNNHYSNLHYVTPRENIKNRNYTEAFYEHNRKIGLLGLHCTVDDISFISLTAAAKYLAELHSKKVDTVRHYFKQHRKYILGHHITYNYLNAETATTDSTE